MPESTTGDRLLVMAEARPPGFRIVPGGPSSAVVMHVPHAATVIPPRSAGNCCSTTRNSPANWNG